ncbi:MAG: serine hydrolase [Clostridia bacterium]|nr:serine hydrolase [Clostridia bacterium]
MSVTTKVSSKVIYEFYKDLEKNDIENHALILMKDGEIVFENYVYPYSADMPHTMFSVTKSVVSTAVGFAVDEGLLSLDDRIIDIFTEYPHDNSEEWENLTLRHVITMQSNKEFSFTQDMTGDYVEMFMKAPFRKTDRGFLYSNNDAQVAASAVQKMAGMNLVEYLTPRLFEPLGIEKPFWETNLNNENIGGTGCHLKLRDLVKICQCYADGGKWNGKQVIPEWWTKEATRLQVAHKNGKDQGYGYLFWIFEKHFSMDGLFGQRVTYLPEYNAVMASFNACVHDNKFTRAFDNILPKAFEETSDGEWDEKLQEHLRKLDKKPVKCAQVPYVPTGKTFYLSKFSDIIAKLSFPASLIPRSITSSYAKRPTSNLNEVSFELTDDVFTVRWKEEEDEVIINCGLDGEPRFSECQIKGYQYKIWAYAFIKDGKLNAVVKPINTLATQYITFDFAEDRVKLQFKSNPSFVEFIKKNADQSSFVKKSGKLRPLIIKAIDKALGTTERPMTFKKK